MPVTVTSLGPTFSTVIAHIGFLVLVQAEVVVKTAQLFELFTTCLARENFIHSFCYPIARVGDCVFIVVLDLEAVELLFFHQLLVRVVVQECGHVEHFSELLSLCCKSAIVFVLDGWEQVHTVL